MKRGFRITGRVQGVGFRWIVQRYARANNLQGWIRNNSDGTVSVAADAPEKSVTALKKWLLASPGLSHVTKIGQETVVIKNKGFIIDRTRPFLQDQRIAMKHLRRSL